MRAQSVLDNLSQCNSGADVHKVGNMRHIATLILELLATCDSIEESDIGPILKRLDSEVVRHFEHKFSYLTQKIPKDEIKR